MKKKQILFFDTTLRDGSQAEKINFSVEDKLAIAKKLDDFGIDYIEGGWPGSNPKDVDFFEKAKKLKLKHGKITAFGSTRYHKFKPQDDPNLKALVEAECPTVCIFGKSWDMHVKDALKISLTKNLEMIEDSIAFLKSKGLEVIFDAEHFFDGYMANPEYAIKTLQAAIKGGADNITLAETNGGRLPFEVADITKKVAETISSPIGIHAHNDSGCAVANSLIAIQEGAVLVQGTINGFGERCGNADLCSILPAVKLKMQHSFFAAKNLKSLTSLSKYVSEMANLEHNHRLPYVGESAFAHKGGIHVSAVQKNSKTYEHISPELVGNKRRVLISDLSGKSNIIYKLKETGIDLLIKDKDVPKQIVQKIKELENQGFDFESANASFELLVKKSMGQYKPSFNLKHFRLINEKTENDTMISEGVVKIQINDNETFVVAEGDGPVNALDKALRKALSNKYPQLKSMNLVDYKVRVLGQNKSTDAKVRVLVTSRKGSNVWTTVGVSENIIDASWQALVDSIDYMLLNKF